MLSSGESRFKSKKISTTLFLEQYLESLQHLPLELQRNFRLMRDLDIRSHNLMKEIDLMADELLPNLPHLDEDEKFEKVEHIVGLFSKAKEYGDDKVQLAIQTYELVDKHIRRLDSDLTRYESEVQDKKKSASQQSANKRKVKSPTSKEGRRKQKFFKEDTSSRSQHTEYDTAAASTSHKKKRRSINSEANGHDKEADLVSLTCPSDVLDMPVDPNEPTYCLCAQVSYGKMIGCDNPECPIEWFHFSCVDLKRKPKGKWYCPKCTKDRRRKLLAGQNTDLE